MMNNMNRSRVWTMLAFVLALLMGMLLAVATTQPARSAHLKVFPGAEGYGTDTHAGRGGTVCQVTNLNDSGAGSLRACVAMSGPRTVIFRTGGTINLQSRITVTNPDISILGQTAPGDGITLRMAPGSATDQGTMQVETRDVLIRYLRFRPGNPGNADDSHDGIQIYKAGVNNVVVDHSSVSWAVDENVNTYDESNNVTVSWSIISEALSNAGHPDGEHSKGMLSGGVNAHNVSIHHNLFASNVDRNPQVSGVSTFDIRNNVLYNYGDGSGNGTTLISSSKGNPVGNIVNNYYRKGPSSPSSYPDWALYSGSNGCVHQVHAAGNKHDETGTVTNATRGSGCDSTPTVATPFATPPVTTTTAEQAYADVLASAGASLVRDAVDQRIVSEVQNRTGSFKDDAATLYPTLNPGTPPADSDGDGLPDSWENGGGGTTPNGDQDGDGYTNIEEWANSLVGGGGPPPPPPTNQAPSVSAGADQTVTLPASANLDGTVTDDGLPSGSTVTQTWTKVSGPGTVTFGNASAVDTTASFGAAGTYVLRLTATDGALSTSDDVQVTAGAAPPVRNPSATRLSTACGVVHVQYDIPADDTAPSDFETRVDGVLHDYEELVPPSFVQSSHGPETLPEDSSGGSADVVVTGNGNTLLSYAVNTNCQQSPPSGVTYLSQSSAFSTTGSVTVTMPPGTEPGDDVVLYVQENKGTGSAITHPSTVTPLGVEVNDGSSLGARTYTHAVTAGSPASFTFTGAFSQMGVHAVAYEGATTVTQVALTTETGSDAAHPVTGTTTATAVNLVMAGDRKYATGAQPSTWMLDAALTERAEGAGPKDGSAFSTVVGDTPTTVAAGAKTYAATASQTSGYAFTALIQVQ